MSLQKTKQQQHHDFQNTSSQPEAGDTESQGFSESVEREVSDREVPDIEKEVLELTLLKTRTDLLSRSIPGTTGWRKTPPVQVRINQMRLTQRAIQLERLTVQITPIPVLSKISMAAIGERPTLRTRKAKSANLRA